MMSACRYKYSDAILETSLFLVHGVFIHAFIFFQSLFCDVRQLMAYIKEIHGGTYRRVALSGLLDSLQKLKREVSQKKEHRPKTSTPIRCDKVIFVVH